MRILKISCVWLALFATIQNVKAQVPVMNSLPEAAPTLFLDFDGHLVDGTSWNWDGTPIVCAGSGLNETQITHVFNRVAEDYRPFKINVTTDSTKFLAAPLNRRMRVIVTTTSSWYGNNAGGVAFIGSFTYGDDTPCFVFSALFGYNLKKISEAISHESGHTFGLYHQARYDDNCIKVTDYYDGQGSGEIGWAPIMGVGYGRNFTLWSYGPNSLGCTNFQSDLDVITSFSNGITYRDDDHPNRYEDATLAIFTNNRFEMEGVISRNDDQDLFRFAMPGKGRFKLDAVPYNVGTGNAGSNLDMQVTLFDDNQEMVGIYNPGTLLSSVADTILNPGTYYLKVEGKGNQYAPSYASLGSYSLHATIEPGEPLPLRDLKLHGIQTGDLHKFNWSIEADESVVAQSLEISTDGRAFTTLASLDLKSNDYTYRPDANGTTHYRLLVVLESGRVHYSNIVTLSNADAASVPVLSSNIIQSGIIQVNSTGNYHYQLVDMNGRQAGRGQLVNGINVIHCDQLVSGLYIIRIWDQKQQWTFKLVKQ